MESAPRSFREFQQKQAWRSANDIHQSDLPTDLYTIAAVLGAAMISYVVKGNPAVAVLCCINFGIGFLVGAEAKRRPIGWSRPISPASATKAESVASKQSAA